LPIATFAGHSHWFEYRNGARFPLFHPMPDSLLLHAGEDGIGGNERMPHLRERA